MKGIVYKSTGSWYLVKDEKGQFWNARLKGKLKIDEAISSTNPIAVGDIVHFDIESGEENTGIIRFIEDRHNYIVRIAPQNKNQKHILAANLDLALVIATITSPRTSTGFIDRFLISAEAYHIPTIIVINKTDLLKEKHLGILEEWKEIYEKAGYTLLTTSITEPASVKNLHTFLKNKTTLFCGHSGAGKSSLINLLIPDKNIKTLKISDWSGKGQHTTTFAEMHDLPNNLGKIIDTPGIKELGIIHIEKEELAHYFPEMRERIYGCRFNNCLHIHEPDCAIKEAVANNKIAKERYINYITILETIG